jgi:Protein of unknown function (DUF1282).
MFSTIFKKIITITSQPQTAWTVLADEKEDHESFLSNFIYPLIGLVAITAFLGVMFAYRDFDIELALKTSVRELSSSLVGFFLAAYCLNKVLVKWFSKESDLKQCQRFVGYSSVLMFALNILLALLPDFFFLKIFVVYTVRIVWEGCEPYMDIANEKKMLFTVLATAFVIITPVVVGFFLGLLMPGLRL